MESTCWTVIEGAARGDQDARSTFARTYLDVVRATLSARWRGSALIARLEDAVQDVFLDCLREGGALSRADRESGHSFRAFLFGVVKRVSLRHEERRQRERRETTALDEDAAPPIDPADDLERVFDRAFARSILARAAQRQRDDAKDEAAKKRVELLELRFHDNLPIRTIAERWQVDAAFLHHEYAKARDEFQRALRTEVAFHHQGPAPSLDAECKRLLTLLRGD